MAIIIVFLIILLLFYSVENVAKYGKGLFNPNFERVDRMFYEKKKLNTNWNTKGGKIVYYVLLVFSIKMFFLFLILLYFQIFK